MKETIQAQADEVVENHLKKEIHRLGECGCISCRRRQQELITGWYRNRELSDEMWEAYLKNLEEEL